MRLAFHKLRKSTVGNDIHVATRGKPDQVSTSQKYVLNATDPNHQELQPSCLRIRREAGVISIS